MAEQILEHLERAGSIISLFAVLIIVVGFAVALARYGFRFRETDAEQNFALFKVELGRALLLGLEILVLADVIESITVPPTFQTVGVLAFLIVVRTAVSWTLALEIEGKWPWQAHKEESGNA